MSIRQCFSSLLFVHNETGNVTPSLHHLSIILSAISGADVDGAAARCLVLTHGFVLAARRKEKQAATKLY
eukprot:2682680-Rhodomonas_salina.1